MGAVKALFHDVSQREGERQTEWLGMRNWHMQVTVKSHHLPCTNWRPRKADGAILVLVIRPENQGSQWCKSLTKGMRRLIYHLRQASRKPGRIKGQIHFSSTFLFYSGLQWIWWFPPTLGRAIYWVQLIQMPISSGNILTDTPRNNILSKYHMAQQSSHRLTIWISKLSAKGQIVIILGFMGHTVSVITMQLCHYSLKVCIDNTWRDWHRYVPIKLYSQKMVTGCIQFTDHICQPLF